MQMLQFMLLLIIVSRGSGRLEENIILKLIKGFADIINLTQITACLPMPGSADSFLPIGLIPLYVNFTSATDKGEANGMYDVDLTDYNNQLKGWKNEDHSLKYTYPVNTSWCIGATPNLNQSMFWNCQRVLDCFDLNDVSPYLSVTRVLNASCACAQTPIPETKREECRTSAIKPPVGMIWACSDGNLHTELPYSNVHHSRVKRHSDAIFTDRYSRLRKQIAAKKYLGSVLPKGKTEGELDPAKLQDETGVLEPSFPKTHINVPLQCTLGIPTLCPQWRDSPVTPKYWTHHKTDDITAWEKPGFCTGTSWALEGMFSLGAVNAPNRAILSKLTYQAEALVNATHNSVGLINKQLQATSKMTLQNHLTLDLLLLKQKGVCGYLGSSENDCCIFIPNVTSDLEPQLHSMQLVAQDTRELRDIMSNSLLGKLVNKFGFSVAGWIQSLLQWILVIIIIITGISITVKHIK
nr:PREDICTED: uncharacterized protein LOC104149991 [Struthio camelus australis]